MECSLGLINAIAWVLTIHGHSKFFAASNNNYETHSAAKSNAIPFYDVHEIPEKSFKVQIKVIVDSKNLAYFRADLIANLRSHIK